MTPYKGADRPIALKTTIQPASRQEKRIAAYQIVTDRRLLPPPRDALICAEYTPRNVLLVVQAINGFGRTCLRFKCLVISTVVRHPIPNNMAAQM